MYRTDVPICELTDEELAEAKADAVFECSLIDFSTMREQFAAARNQHTLWTKKEYGEYLKSDHWQKVRSDAKLRAGVKCQLCGRHTTATLGKQLEVHHNNYDHFGHESPEDIIVLCNRCHEKHHGVSE